MTSKLTAFAACAAALFVFSQTASAEPFLADRHANYNADCASCHVNGAPAAGAVVEAKTCLSCHQSYEALAKRTAAIKPNPHASHLLDIDCADCHKGHAASQAVCSGCHKFQTLQMK